MLKRIAAGVLIVLMSVSICGCVALVAGVAGGAGTATWLSNKLVQEVNAPFDKTIQAVKSGLKALGLDVTKETKKDMVAQIMSNYTDGKTVWIDVHKVSESTSRVEVRVGMIGDEEAARNILESIMKYLS